MDADVLLALSKSSSTSIGLLFTFVVLLPAIATVLVIVSMVSGRGENAQDATDGGRWGRRPPSGSA
ncbi:MAG: hypothetical protein QOJ63_169 [Solirubrobacteraceae bacterium]|jgi:hypothetical protein|nr:hypothetical protein [Solirubrobacteraceae bacterium]